MLDFSQFRKFLRQCLRLRHRASRAFRVRSSFLGWKRTEAQLFSRPRASSGTPRRKVDLFWLPEMERGPRSRSISGPEKFQFSNGGFDLGLEKSDFALSTMKIDLQVPAPLIHFIFFPRGKLSDVGGGGGQQPPTWQKARNPNVPVKSRPRCRVRFSRGSRNIRGPCPPPPPGMHWKGRDLRGGSRGG